MIKLPLLFALSLIMLKGSAQIEGSVVGKNKVAIQNAAIIISDSLGKIIDSVASDHRGGYSFTGLKPGLYNITTKVKGYEPSSYKNIRVTIAPEGTDENDDTYYAIRIDLVLMLTKPQK
ncbi:MAG TPA: carboxypeptidase-like regulatory domain-containing protein [Chitinophagaceae bacterium]|nr:carboxypeptidase-like regulatory domain-containing protein [Chitinophagaceae bacterium]